jgi:hypothetical protein
VLSYTNYPPSDPTGLGNVLQSYVQGGGGLVLSTYAYTPGYAIEGGIMSPGYSPLTDTGNKASPSGSLVATVPSSPIFNGVDLSALTYFDNSNFAQPGLDSGATLLATDGAGLDMIAINSTGDIIGNNLYPGDCCGVNNSEFYKLIGNELLDVAGQESTAVPEPSSIAVLLAGLGLIGGAFYFRRKKATAA